MAELPTLLTEWLLLRPFTLKDAPFVQRIAGVREIADTTISIPHKRGGEEAPVFQPLEESDSRNA